MSTSMIAAANQITMFDGSSALELESFTKNCMRYAKAAYDGPVGTLLSFWQKKLIKKLFIQYGLPWAVSGLYLNNRLPPR